MTSPSKMLVTRWSVDLLVLISLINLTELARGGGDGGVNQLGHFRVSSTSTDNHSKRVLNRRRRLVEIVATVSALWPISCIIFNNRSISMNIRLPRFFENFVKFCVTFFASTLYLWSMEPLKMSKSPELWRSVFWRFNLLRFQSSPE